MSKLSNMIANRLIIVGLNPDNREIYVYAIESILNSTAIFGTIILLGAISQNMRFALAWMAFFLPVRHTSGGSHASSHLSCYVISVIIGVICMVLPKYFSSAFWLVLVGIVFSIIVVFKCAPVLHENHPMSQNRITRMRQLAKRIVILESIIVIACSPFIPGELYFSAMLGILTATGSTLIGYIQNVIKERQ